jgi:topoisomerase-4 subunit A
MDEERIEPIGESAEESNSGETGKLEIQKSLHLSGMYQNWFLDYASYVILERAVPDIHDGLKPVQRRLLHSMKELDDGRYNKVANIIGHTMKYHPHGDASIGDALVQMGQKELVIDAQGNWGNIFTGDSAAAPRYIEARLSKFALEVVFNPKTTTWKLSYDGRNKEPITLPVKFPLLLAHGAEGIAVGLASKILPHNFIEIIDACIDRMNGIITPLFPDFLTGGAIDVTRYNDGLRGGRVRIRAKISQIDKKTLVVSELPFGCTTTSLIDSILTANDKGKIKIRKIDDNTSDKVEIIIHLVPGVSPDTTIDALYAFTDCEITIAPNSCVIEDGRPRFASVSEILAKNCDNIVDLLRRELEIKRSELREQWLFSSLEKIFIENKIYLKIEDCETWESVIETIDKGLDPYKKIFYRTITQDDIIRLTEIKIKRISKFDAYKAEDLIRKIEEDIRQIEHYLNNLITYAIDYMLMLKEKFGKGKGRKTEIRSFDTIEASMVAAATQKLYVNRLEGFAGTSLKKDEFICDCSDIDDIIIIRENGSLMVTKVNEKIFIGENVLHIAIFKKNDERTIYNVVYQDGKKGNVMVKRFAVVGVTRDKEYNVTKGTPDSRIMYFSANPNGEAEVLNIILKPKPKLRKLNVDFDFSSISIKNRNSIGNILSRNPVRKIVKKEEGISTLGARDIWWDEIVRRLNAEGRGLRIGAFEGDAKILTIYQSGYYRLTNFDLTNHFEEDLLIIEKYNPEKVITAIYLDGETRLFYVKRFQVELSDKKVDFIGEEEGNKLIHVTASSFPVVDYTFEKKKTGEKIAVNQELAEFIGVKSFRAKGKRLSEHEVVDLTLSFLPEPENEEEQVTPADATVSEPPATIVFDDDNDDDDRPEGTPVQMTLDF